jgi:hypothetical protein
VARQFPDLVPEELPWPVGIYGTLAHLPGDLLIPVHTPFPSSRTGTGRMLIRWQVFPDFRERHRDLWSGISEKSQATFLGYSRMHNPFRTMKGADGIEISEDLSFCEHWRAIEGQVHACAWHEVQRLGTYE